MAVVTAMGLCFSLKGIVVIQISVAFLVQIVHNACVPIFKELN